MEEYKIKRVTDYLLSIESFKFVYGKMLKAQIYTGICFCLFLACNVDLLFSLILVFPTYKIFSYLVVENSLVQKYKELSDEPAPE